MPHSKTMKEAAYEYLKRGMVTLPIKQRGKEPFHKEWQERTLESVNVETDFSEGSDCNIGVLLGLASEGLVDIDLDCSKAILIAPLLLPKTEMTFGRQGAPRSHYLYRVADCGSSVKYSGIDKDGVLIEYRADKAQTVFPPSIHKTGQSVKFYENGEPAKVQHNELLEKVQQVAAASLLAKHWPKGQRHDTALALSGTLLSRGWAKEDVELFIKVICIGANDDERRDRIGTVSSTKSAQLKNQPTTGFTRLQEILGAKITDKVSDWLDLEFYNCGFGHNSDGGIGHNSSIQRNDALRYTDIGNAEKFVETYGDQVRYCHELAEWISWNNKKWTIGDKVSIERMAESTIRAFEKEAEQIADIRDRDAFFDWIKRSGNRSHIKAMYEQAQHRLNIDHGKLDADLDVINVNGKMIDLRTGNARPIEQSDLSTKSMGVVYDTEAQCPQFNEFLDQIMNGSAELINYLQRAVGYTLTGHTSEQCLFIAHGIGANGKSVFLNLIKKLMGDYAMTTPMASLVSLKTNSGASNDIARLRGARFVSASEGEANQKLKVALIKQLTGGDTITARHLFHEFFEFIPHFSMWIATNFKPKVSGDDLAIWRRIYLIPFKVSIPPDEQDKNLSQKLEKEMPGILNWALQGSKDWYRDGLMPPSEVLLATEKYRTEMDGFSRFLDEGIITERLEAQTSKAELYSVYSQWCTDEGVEMLTKMELGTRMKQRGYEEGRSNSGRYWKNMAIEDAEEYSL